MKFLILLLSLMVGASAFASEKSTTASKVLAVREAQDLMSREHGPSQLKVYTDGTVKLYYCPRNMTSKCNLFSKGKMTDALLEDYKRVVNMTLKLGEYKRPEPEIRCKAMPRERVTITARGVMVATLARPCGNEYSKNGGSDVLITLLDGLFDSLDQDDGNDR